mmetsp:Transcript_15865/g.28101  ORF Transcript_15865/g.28101 Transcript_15865/m.28101 type:complete len:141 (-) Transcript_15865:1183-1605(-)
MTNCPCITHATPSSRSIMLWTSQTKKTQPPTHTAILNIFNWQTRSLLPSYLPTNHFPRATLQGSMHPPIIVPACNLFCYHRASSQDGKPQVVHDQLAPFMSVNNPTPHAQAPATLTVALPTAAWTHEIHGCTTKCVPWLH